MILTEKDTNFLIALINSASFRGEVVEYVADLKKRLESREEKHGERSTPIQHHSV